MVCFYGSFLPGYFVGSCRFLFLSCFLSFFFLLPYQAAFFPYVVCVRKLWVLPNKNTLMFYYEYFDQLWAHLTFLLFLSFQRRWYFFMFRFFSSFRLRCTIYTQIMQQMTSRLNQHFLTRVVSYLTQNVPCRIQPTTSLLYVTDIERIVIYLPKFFSINTHTFLIYCYYSPN